MSAAALALVATAAPAATARLAARLRALPVIPLVLLGLALGIGFQVVAGVGLFHLDIAVSRDHWRHELGPSDVLTPLAYEAQRLGQRGVILAVAVPLVAWLAGRVRSWRPLGVLLGAAIIFNVVVGALKVLTARPRPIDGIAHTFVGGTEFPSGHAAGAVVMWGAVAYLVHLYLPQAAGRRVSPRVLVALVAGITLIVSLCSLYLDMHWLSDLLAAWAVGGLLLWVVMAVERRTRPGLTSRGAPEPEPQRVLQPV